MSCGCGRKSVKEDAIEAIKKFRPENIKWNFSENELQDFITWFNHESIEGVMKKTIFQQALGLISYNYSTFLIDRMFDVMDTDSDGEIKLKDFLNFMAILFHGTDEERYKQSFQMMDIKKKGKITKEDFLEYIKSTSAMISTMLNTKVTFDDQIVNELFKMLDEKSKNFFSEEDYQNVLKKNPGLFEYLDFTADKLPQLKDKITKMKAEQLFPKADLKIIENQFDFLEHEILKLYNKVDPSFDIAKPNLKKFNLIKPLHSPNSEGMKNINSKIVTAHKKVIQIDPEKIALDSQLSKFGPEAKEFAESEQFEEDKNSTQVIKTREFHYQGNNTVKFLVDKPFDSISRQKEMTKIDGHRIPDSKESEYDCTPPEDENIDSPSRDFRKMEFLQRNVISRNPGMLFQKLIQNRMFKKEETLNLSEIKIEDGKEETKLKFDDLEGIKSGFESILSVIKEYKLSISKKIGGNIVVEEQKLGIVDQMKVTQSNIPVSVRGQEFLLKNNERKMKKGFVHFAHQDFILVFNMMIGIEKALNTVVDVPNEKLEKAQFKLRSTYHTAPSYIDTNKTYLKIKSCKFVDYAPQVFNNIRRISGISNESYIASLGPHKLLNLFNSLKNNWSWTQLSTTGKSGSFFYYTDDSKFILKTIRDDEFAFLKEILQPYYEHIKNNPNTLMTKFFGLHKMIFFKKGSLKRSKKIKFLIMSNVFCTNKSIDIRFDLKGSKVDRLTIKKLNQQVDHTIARKEGDLEQQKKKFHLPDDIKARILDQIRKDSTFFGENNILDYSLLVGIHLNERNQDDRNINPEENSLIGGKNLAGNMLGSIYPNGRDYSSGFGEILSKTGNEIYYIGIIDTLTRFNCTKKLEFFFLRFRHGYNMSCIPPKDYAKRFQEYLRTVFD